MPRLHTITLSALLLTLPAAAQAGRDTIEDALKSREELSVFYQALLANGVMDELGGWTSYTVLAPTNEAFAASLPKEEYGCLYNATCKKEAAAILKNHIVEREQPLHDVVGRKGGIFALSDHLVRVTEPTNRKFRVDGHEVISTHGLLGSILYQIGGVITEDKQLMALERASYRMERDTAPAVGTATDMPLEKDSEERN